MAAESDLWRGSARVFDYRCAPGDASWSTENCTGDGWVVAFPGTAVRISVAGHDEVLADATVVTLYAPHQPYRRRIVDPRGDACTAVALGAEAVRDLLAGIDPAADADPQPALPASWAPLPPGALARQRRLAARLRRGTATDPLEVEEEVGAIVGAALGARARLDARRARVATTLPTARARLRLVEDAKHAVAADLGAPLSLAELGRRVAASPYHLARVFRSQTGLSLHGYRTQLRLAAALDAVLAGNEPLAEVAARTGFASHSHLTGAFRSAYGETPSRLRA